MADFVAVLRKTLDGLSDPNAETRERVYERARATVLARLEAIQPPPPAAVADRQIKALEDAIALVEQDYAPPPRQKPLDPLDELEDVFASLNGLKDQATIPMRPIAAPVVAPAAKPFASAVAPRPSAYEPRKPLASPTLAVGPTPTVAPRPIPAATPPVTPLRPLQRDTAPVFEAPVRREPELAARPSGSAQPASAPVDDEPDFDESQLAGSEREPRRGFGGLIAAVLAVAALAGAGYGVWVNKDEFSRMVGIGQPADPAATSPAETPLPAEEPADVAAAPPVAEPPAVTPEATAPGRPPKLTQRLNDDGSETDVGPATGGASVGEGTSVAAATQPSQPPAAPEATPPVDVPPPADVPPTDPLALPATAGTPPVTPDPAAPPADAAPATVAVGQKAIFYEERTSAAAGSAEEGSTVWSVVQESPGADRPPEPAIRAVATIPGKDVELRMTIRRNADPTLPASHIIEMIFLTPDNSTEGTVDNILRMTMKGAEQEAGNPVIGLPAKIGDGFFLIALNDNKAEIDANMNLLQRQNWIDIPVVYKSGRRALITMEKGIPGEKVFDDVLKGWGVSTGG